MSKLFSIAILGLAAAGLTLTAPSTSYAQRGWSIQFNYGQGGYYGPSSGFGLRYGQGSPYGGYNRSYHNDHHGHSHHGHGGYGQRPIIVQPSYSHWTPNRGYHSHGTVIIPHRNHYHVRPY
jgi:hypothetical protein